MRFLHAAEKAEGLVKRQLRPQNPHGEHILDACGKGSTFTATREKGLLRHCSLLEPLHGREKPVLP